jgi:hypothetical protein
MTTKTTGAEFWRFYNDRNFWPEGSWHDDTLILVNGEEVGDYTRETIPDDAKVVIEGGIVYLDERGKDDVAFESYFRRWRRVQSTASLTVEVPKDKLEAVKAAIRAAGGKVV